MGTKNEWSCETDDGIYQIEAEPFHDGCSVCFHSSTEACPDAFVVKFTEASPETEAAIRFHQGIDILERYASADSERVPLIARLIDVIDGPVQHEQRVFSKGYLMPRYEPLDAYVLRNGDSVGRVGCGKTLSTNTAVDICIEIAESLHVLGLPSGTEGGVTHRDIKPASLLRDLQTGRWHLAGFGIAKQHHPGRISTRESSGEKLGTPGYMAPEQAIENGEIGPPTDVFGLAATLCELVTGAPPFPRHPTGDKCAAGLLLHELRDSGSAVPVRSRNPELPERLAAIIDKGLSKNASKRQRDCGEFADALKAFRGETATCESPVAITSGGRQRLHHPLVWTVITLPFLLFLAVWLGRPDEKTNPRSPSLETGTQRQPAVEKSSEPSVTKSLQLDRVAESEVENRDAAAATWSQYSRAFELLKQRKHSEAERLIAPLLESGSIYGQLGMGWLHIARREYEQALPFFVRAIARNPTGRAKWNSHTGITKVYCKLGMQQEFEDSLKTLMSFEATAAKDFKDRAELLLLLGDTKRAKSEAQLAIKADSSYRTYFEDRNPQLLYLVGGLD